MKRFEKKIRYYLGYFFGLSCINFVVMLFVRGIISPYVIFGLYRNEINFWTNFDIINTIIFIFPLGIATGLLLALRFVEIYGVVIDA